MAFFLPCEAYAEDFSRLYAIIILSTSVETKFASKSAVGISPIWPRDKAIGPPRNLRSKAENSHQIERCRAATTRGKSPLFASVVCATLSA